MVYISFRSPYPGIRRAGIFAFPCSGRVHLSLGFCPRPGQKTVGGSGSTSELVPRAYVFYWGELMAVGCCWARSLWAFVYSFLSNITFSGIYRVGKRG